MQFAVDLPDLLIADRDVFLHQAEAVIERFDRRREWAVPEWFEIVAHRFHRFAHEQRIAIAKIVIVVVAEISIRHVPPAGDSGDAVDH